ncbi:MAG: LacI family DNA-binding transcriptional regulator [Acidobacteriaceae bacterium]|nr:LacI family DNA-binding transcriptional regulator [Acidobacteriaceae bacterium]
MSKPVRSTPSSPSKAISRAKRPATLADVAREAGVVAMTASRAINGTGYVSEAVRAKVQKAAQKLQYRPNMLARQLKGRRLNAIGVMLPDIANPFASELIEGMKQVLDPLGYTAFLTTAGRGVEQERAGLQALVDHRVDGLIVATRGTLIGNEAIKTLAQQGIPIVTIGRPIENVPVDCIAGDHYQGAFDVVSHLIKLGHKRIGFIGIAPEDSHTLRRHEGYAAALKQAGLTFRPEYTVGPANAPAFATQEDGYEGMQRLAALKNPPTAVFARNDFAAIGALRAAHELGLRIPEDIAIAGFDNIPLAAYSTPPLTTVQQPIREQGKLGAQMLVDRIEGKLKGPHQLQRMACQLVVRGSTDAKNSAGKKKKS